MASWFEGHSGGTLGYSFMALVCRYVCVYVNAFEAVCVRLWVCVTPCLSLQPGVMMKVQEEDATLGETPVVSEEVTSGRGVYVCMALRVVCACVRN